MRKVNAAGSSGKTSLKGTGSFIEGPSFNLKMMKNPLVGYQDKSFEASLAKASNSVRNNMLGNQSNSILTPAAGTRINRQTSGFAKATAKQEQQGTSA